MQDLWVRNRVTMGLLACNDSYTQLDSTGNAPYLLLEASDQRVETAETVFCEGDTPSASVVITDACVPFNMTS